MTASNKPKIGAILLAAGGSSRLGRPKQLLQFQGKTLFRIALETLTETSCRPIVAVLGAGAERLTAELEGLPVDICINKTWQEGMSSSIKNGLSRVLDLEPSIDAVVIALCDQPHITSDDITRLISGFTNSRSPLVAARYSNTTGVPALFSAAMFDGLRSLTGDKGARQLIRDHPENVLTVPIENAAIDIDTLDDAGGLNSA